MTALAHSLQLRGHQVVIFGIADTEARVRAAGIEFYPIGAEDYPPGALQVLDDRLARLRGLSAFRFIVERVKNTTRMVLRDGPEAVRKSEVDGLLIDQAEFAGSIADLLNLPQVSIALIPPIVPDDRFPPFWFGWPAGQDWLSRFRNRLGMSLLKRIFTPILAEVNRNRTAWGLEPIPRPEDFLLGLVQITQLPKALEFEAAGEKLSGLFYTGPFLHPERRSPVEFPWERLDGRRLIYASLGTLQNGEEHLFRTIAEACRGLDAQLLISLGGGLDPSILGNLPGDPVVVSFAPQLDILKRASVVITHAGINTVLESLSEGVPMVAVPLAHDQPGMAARVKAHGAGVVVPPRGIHPARLRKAILLVLEEPGYRMAAQVLQKAILQLDGPAMAADLIEEVLNLRATPQLA